MSNEIKKVVKNIFIFTFGETEVIKVPDPDIKYFSIEYKYNPYHVFWKLMELEIVILKRIAFSQHALSTMETINH